MATKKSKGEATLVAVAETIGSALGSLAATGETAKRAFQSAASAPLAINGKARKIVRGTAKKRARAKKASRKVGRRRSTRPRA